MRADSPGFFVRAATAAAEQDDAVHYFMRSAAHEAIASGDLTLACVGASRSAPVMDALLATFIEDRGVWVSRDRRSVDLHICPVAGIAAAYLRLHHVYVPRVPTITLGHDPGGPCSAAP